MNKINKVMIANRGEIACRILRTLDRMSIASVMVYHAVDEDSPAVATASETVEIDGSTPVAAYLDMDRIIAACKETDADAVHPGFGFLAENPEFARRLAHEGIKFIGPSPENIELMGNKVKARSFCIDNGFPLAPSVTEASAGEQFAEQARKIGVPLLIKAAAGGGGKGMQIVRDLDNLEPAIQLVKTASLRAFGDDAVYAERYEEKPRHIEVQVLADEFGNVVHLGDRECSIQRRFQKIIEESPAPRLESDLRKLICTTAVEIARRAGYCNAGTVEFLLSPDGDIFFLEMNTRIQVEHPITEMVTGIDLVEMQIRIAQGEPLPFNQDQVKTKGHAIELRLYAEDPECDFLPTTGQLLSYSLPVGCNLRVDDGFIEGMKVTTAFDPMLAKLIIHGKTRNEAIERAQKAIADTLILGITTNIDYLARIIAHPAFAAGQIHTGFISQYSDDLNPPALTKEQRHLLLAAAALSSREFTNPEFDAIEPYASIGNWRN
jgi:propionyl-CoA carboxylase alpha chain/3-methylcrotonyl-CoA carboxylase alpha subunit/acetyl-CoA/propionyl-CoA carboxylase biotin carboxyl carrier protein